MYVQNKGVLTIIQVVLFVIRNIEILVDDTWGFCLDVKTIY